MMFFRYRFTRVRDMGITKKQKGVFGIKTPVGVMKYKIAESNVDLIKILAAVTMCRRTAVPFYKP